MSFPSISKKPLLLLLTAVFAGVLLLFPLLREKSLKSEPPLLCDYSISRVKGFEFVRPPMTMEPVCESKTLLPLRKELARLTDSLKNTGVIRQASVYVREFERGEWLSVNDAERYHPASLMKIALMLSILQMTEANPGLLKENLAYEKPRSVEITPQFFNYPAIEAGKSYTVHELLYYMIANSDNNATWLLSGRVDFALTKKLFADLGLPEPATDDLKFTLTARECAVFFDVIYNAALFGPEYADYAARLLSNCAFREGFRKGFPENTRMWHKFGEWRHAGHDYELHEAGVVYLRERPYLVAVMTRGTDTEKQAAAIQVLTRAIGKRAPALTL